MLSNRMKFRLSLLAPLLLACSQQPTTGGAATAAQASSADPLAAGSATGGMPNGSASVSPPTESSLTYSTPSPSLVTSPPGASSTSAGSVNSGVPSTLPSPVEPAASEDGGASLGSTPSPALPDGSTGAPDTTSSADAPADGSAPTDSYDARILMDGPVAYFAMTGASTSELDLSGNQHVGTYHGATVETTPLPNQEPVARFNGEDAYLSIPSSAAFSVTTTGNLTWEAWIQADVLQFPEDGGSGYVDWMGKCAEYAPTCEWEARMYSTTNDEGRCNRISAYIFNPSAGLGSAADFQPECGLIQEQTWYHVVGQYTLLSEPDDCDESNAYPGSIEIWVNGVQWDHSHHGQTGCMGQYQVLPEAGDSPVNIGTMAGDGWFPGAIGKVAIYDYLLTGSQIAAHYQAMTGNAPTGSCGNTCTW